MPRFLPLTALLLLVPSVFAADKPDTKAGDAMIDKYLATQAKTLSGRFLDGAKTREEWEKKLPRLRREYLDMLGLWPLPEKTPLQGDRDRHPGTRRRRHREAALPEPARPVRHGEPVSAESSGRKPPTSCRPSSTSAATAFRGRDGNKTAFQDHGLWFANNGYICLIVDTLAARRNPRRPPRHLRHAVPPLRQLRPARQGYVETRWWWQALGYTPAGVECWNGIRGIDYLCSRPDVDPERIGVTGISGGGAATFWIAAADDARQGGRAGQRHERSGKLRHQQGHQRPLRLHVPGEHLPVGLDDHRRPDRPAAAAVRQLGQRHDLPDGRQPPHHRQAADSSTRCTTSRTWWTNTSATAATPTAPTCAWRSSSGSTSTSRATLAPVKDADFKPLPGKELRVFPEEKDFPKDAINGKIDETFVTRAEVKLPEEGKFAAWKKGMVKELRERVVSGVSRRKYGQVQVHYPVMASIGNSSD